MVKSIFNDISKLTPGMKFGKELLKKANFGADYDFFYLPIDFNVIYAFTKI
jgi:hypothetical protein